MEGGRGGGTRTVRVANCWHDVDGATREGDASVTEDTRDPTSEASFSVGTLGRGRRGDSGVPLLETGRIAKGAAAATATHPAARAVAKSPENLSFKNPGPEDSARSRRALLRRPPHVGVSHAGVRAHNLLNLSCLSCAGRGGAGNWPGSS